ncbi:hypothetical protein H8784_19700 [Parabacteroides acidifaciens]|uniref:Uncharacterized protein n=1 Tax=Parabacteroides acidifaciens TaxID=2290935 RepID=A0ABR7P6E7_9BACT|nr:MULTISPECIES: hypothetical protein [Bacteroidales]MBC8603933.1 hypothetical protein [Parabacteroides acidifaciens]MCU6769084.1 hypothetical protein [Barnesiella propionica]
MKKWQKILLIFCHIVTVSLFAYILINGLQLRWRLGYVIFWIAALSGIALYFTHFNKYICNALIKLYAFCWVLLSIIGGVITFLTYDSVYCETDEYIMKEAKGFMGFDTAVLYKKYGLREIEIHRYELVFPKSITPIDSLGAIIIYGEYPDGEGGCDKGAVVYPMNDEIYYNNIDKIKEYAEQCHISFDSL